MSYTIYKLEFECIPIYVGITKQNLAKRKTGGWPKIPNEILTKCVLIEIEQTEDKTREYYWIKKYIGDGYSLYNENLPSNVNFNECDNLIDFLVTKKKEKNNRKLENYNYVKKGHNQKKSKGYCWNKKLNKWQAYYIYNSKNFHLGYFDTEEEAIKAFNEYLLTLNN